MALGMLKSLRRKSKSVPGSVRERAVDRTGKVLAAGTKVRVVGEDGRPEGTIVRVLEDYGVVTVLLEKPAKAERMYPTSEVEAV